MQTFGYLVIRKIIRIKERVRGQEDGEEGESWREHPAKLEAVFEPLGTWIPRSAEEMSLVEQRPGQGPRHAGAGRA
jgi:hypothetical protein